MEQLKESIEVSFLSNIDNKDFMPRREVEKVLNERAIHQAIQDAVREKLFETFNTDDIVRAILNGARRTFAILVLSGCPKMILSFTEYNNIDSEVDAKLPFEKVMLQETYGLSDIETLRFYKWQWHFTAPIFDFESALPKTFYDHVILPFQKGDGEYRLGGGGFGNVYQVVINPRHQENPPRVSLVTPWLFNLPDDIPAHRLY